MAHANGALFTDGFYIQESLGSTFGRAPPRQLDSFRSMDFNTDYTRPQFDQVTEGPGPGGTLHPPPERRGKSNLRATQARNWAGEYRTAERRPVDMAEANLQTIMTYDEPGASARSGRSVGGGGGGGGGGASARRSETARSQQQQQQQVVGSARGPEVPSTGRLSHRSGRSGRSGGGGGGGGTGRSQLSQMAESMLDSARSSSSSQLSTARRGEIGSVSRGLVSERRRQRHRRKLHHSLHEHKMGQVWDRRQQELIEYQKHINQELSEAQAVPAGLYYNPVTGSFEHIPGNEHARISDGGQGGRGRGGGGGGGGGAGGAGGRMMDHTRSIGPRGGNPNPPDALPHPPEKRNSLQPRAPKHTKSSGSLLTVPKGSMPMFTLGKLEQGRTQPFYDTPSARAIRGEYKGLTGPHVHIGHEQHGAPRHNYDGSPFKVPELPKDPQRSGKWKAPPDNRAQQEMINALNKQW